MPDGERTRSGSRAVRAATGTRRVGTAAFAKMAAPKFGLTYVERAGFNAWAETNNVEVEDYAEVPETDAREKRGGETDRSPTGGIYNRIHRRR